MRVLSSLAAPDRQFFTGFAAVAASVATLSNP